MKKALIILIVLISVVVVATLIYRHNNQSFANEENGIKTTARIEDGHFWLYENGSFNQTFIKGVNLGATKPGYFPGELGITKSDYLRWFQYISDMNANTIRVYTTMMPHFYEALLEHNQAASNPLYLMQGVWLNEDYIKLYRDPYAEDQLLMNEFIQDGKDLIDIFHGNKTLPERPGFASGTYTADISNYVIAWILGVEWDPLFVTNTNQLHPDKNHYEGKYLYTKQASPFEAFLTKVGDSLLTYEADQYQQTRPISFTNWLTTDPLTHIHEPDPKEDMVSVNVEHIKTTKRAFAKQFASYHIYPYYPEFMNYSEAYIEKFDPVNTYKAYLRDLNKHHNMPILVAEFGVPSSRGKAHDARFSGYNQGNHSEREQGLILQSLIHDIHEEDYIGALIFAFQDEWFKRTWNTMDFDLAWQRPFWSNVETNEQMFGLLAFEPGDQLKVKLDKDDSDWTNIPYVYEDTYKLKATSDERYLYLYVSYDDVFKDEPLYIAIDTIDDQGNFSYTDKQITYDKGVDFLITIDTVSRIQVDPYYDAFSHLYGEVLGMIEQPDGINTKDSKTFVNMYHALSKALIIPNTNEVFPFSKYEAGLLKSGYSDPNHDAFDSLADYLRTDQFVEIRVPWLLLNVMDPSTKAQMKDFKGDSSFTHQTYEGFNIGVSNANSAMTLMPFTYESWSMPSYHERLKQSYYIIKDTFDLL